MIIKSVEFDKKILANTFSRNDSLMTCPGNKNITDVFYSMPIKNTNPDVVYVQIVSQDYEQIVASYRA